MKRRHLVVALTVVVLLAALTPAAGQDAVKAEIRQAIDAACLNALWNGPDTKAFLAGWDHGAMAPMRLMGTGELAYVAVAELIALDLRDNSKPSEKKEFTFLYPVIDVTGDIAMARVEAMRGETIVTRTTSRWSRPRPGGRSSDSRPTCIRKARVRKSRPARPMRSRRWWNTRSCAA